MSKLIELLYEPRKHFQEFHNRAKRWSCIVAHRRAGKTVACINELIERSIFNRRINPAPRYAYVAPYYSQAKQIAWEYLKHYARPITINISESELSVDLINGARIRLYGADNSDAMRGIYLDGCILDEPADIRPRFWGEIIRPTLSDYHGWACFIGTPRGHNHFYDIHKQALSSPDWFSLVLRASQTGILPADELESARRTTTPDQYQQEYECSFEAAILGAIYGIEMREASEQGRITHVPHDPNLSVFTAWDLGRTDDTSIWWYQMVRGEIRLIDFYSTSGGEAGTYLSQLLGHHVEVDIIDDKIVPKFGNLIPEITHRQQYKYERHWLPEDAKAKTFAAKGKSTIEQLAAVLKLSTLEIVPDIGREEGIKAARLTIPRCLFDAKRCDEGIEALKQYQRQWDEDKKAPKENPLHDWTSHPADAFRMLAVAWREEAKPKEPPKPKFWHEQTLNELWDENPRRSRRI